MSGPLVRGQDAVDEEPSLARGVTGEGLEAGVVRHLSQGRDPVWCIGASDEVCCADGVGDAEGGLDAVGGELSAGNASDVVEAPGAVGEDRRWGGPEVPCGSRCDGGVERPPLSLGIAWWAEPPVDG